MASAAPSLARPLRVLGWAAYLSCSWTWCIGMFLPVLLMRDSGAWAWAVFAVPNVAGAAAMGFVLRDREASERIVRRHAVACLGFSLVTVAFHLYFLAWMAARLPATGVLAGFVAGAGVLAWAATGRGRGRALSAAGAVTAVTLVFGAWLLRAAPLLPDDYAFGTELRAGRLAALLPVCLFGFLLCPYLDLTFHRARRENGRADARAAFAVGFGLLFPVAIALTLLYGGPLARLAAGRPAAGLPAGLAAALGFYVALQSAFTMGAHLREARPVLRSAAGTAVTAAVLLAALVIVEARLLTRISLWSGLDPWEVGYWLFLGAYGMAFPAYVWTWIVPGRGKSARPTPWGLFVLGTALAAATPLFWLGFVEARPLWLPIGVALLLLARPAARRAA